MLIIFLLSLPLLVTSYTCEDFLTGLQTKFDGKDFSDLSQQEAAFFGASAPTGAALGLGDKEACDSAPYMKYYVGVRSFIKTLGFKTGNHHGICLPRECATPEKEHDEDFIRKIFAIQKWEIKKGDGLMLYDPESEIVEKGFLFYMTCLLFSFFFFMSIGSAIYVYIHKLKQGKVIIHHDEHVDNNIHEHEHEHEHESHEKENFHDHDKSPHGNGVIHESLHTSHHELHHEILHTTPIAEQKPHWIFQAFDIKENYLALIKTAKEAHTDENLEVLGLLKIGTVCFVLYANAFAPYVKYVVDTQSFTDFFTTVPSKLNLSADFTSEYFFVMGGFLCAAKVIPHLSKHKFTVGVWLCHLRQKLFQVWPLFIMSLLFFWQLSPHFFKGPLGFTFRWEVESCNKVWWTKFLYIENITNGYTIKGAQGYCIPTVWYMAAEYQVFAIGLLVLALYVKSRTWGYVACIVLYFQAFGLAVLSFYRYDLTFEATHPTLYETKYKWTPCKRWSNYFLGAICGMLYYEYNNLNKKNMFSIFEKSKIISYGVMIFGVCSNLFLVFFIITKDTMPSIWNEDLGHMWFGIRVVLTGASMLCIFMPMAAHRDCIIKKFLLLRPFQVFSKYTASLYIYHQGINYALTYSRTEDVEKFSHGAVCVQTILVILIGEIVATSVHLMIERPFMKIEAKIAEEHVQYHPMIKDKKLKDVEPKFKAAMKKQLELEPVTTSGFNLQVNKTDNTSDLISPGSGGNKANKLMRIN